MQQTTPSQSQQPQKTGARTAGLLILIIPPTVLFLTIVSYSLIYFVVSAVGASLVIASISSMILGIVGMFAVLGCLIGIPVGLYLMTKGK